MCNYLNLYDYENNSIISLVDNILILDCFLKEGSFDQIAQLNFNASANIGISLSWMSSLACDSNSLHELSGNNLIKDDNSVNFSLNCFELSPEYFKISDLFFFNSSNTYFEENNCKFNNLDLDMNSLTGFGLKNENNILVSITNSIHQPSFFNLSQTASLILFPNLSASLSYGFSDSNCFSISSFQANCLALDSMQDLTNPDQLISEKFFICSRTSFGIDKVIDTISVEKHKNVELFKSFDFENVVPYKEISIKDIIAVEEERN